MNPVRRHNSLGRNYPKERATIVILSSIYILTLLVLSGQESSIQVIFGLVVLPFLVWISANDLRSYEIPDLATLGVTVTALAYLFHFNPSDLLKHAASGIATTSVLWIVGEVYFRRYSQEGLGIGDAKLFGASVLLNGPIHIPDLLLLSSLGGLCMTLLSKLRGASSELGVPFGPYIAYATYIVFFLDPLFL